MAIDIRQLVIKSNVADDACESENESENNENSDSNVIKLKQDVMIECRRMIIEMLNDKGLR